MPKMRTRAKMKVVASDRERRPNVLRHILLIYANNEPKSALARDLGDCRDNKGKLAKRVFTCLQEIPMELSVKKWTQVIRKIHI